MAKWRTNRSFSSVCEQIDNAMRSGHDIKLTVPIVSSGSKYPIYDAWMDFLKNGGHVDYPGGLEQFEKDAMREKAQMLQDRGCSDCET